MATSEINSNEYIFSFIEVTRMECFHQAFPWPRTCHCLWWTLRQSQLSQEKNKTKHGVSTSDNPLVLAQSSQNFYNFSSQLSRSLFGSCQISKQLSLHANWRPHLKAEILWNLLFSEPLANWDICMQAPRRYKIFKLWLEFCSSH